jgi:hypothetical protein
VRTGLSLLIFPWLNSNLVLIVLINNIVNPSAPIFFIYVTNHVLR